MQRPTTTAQNAYQKPPENSICESAEVPINDQTNTYQKPPEDSICPSAEDPVIDKTCHVAGICKCDARHSETPCTENNPQTHKQQNNLGADKQKGDSVLNENDNRAQSSSRRHQEDDRAEFLEQFEKIKIGKAPEQGKMNSEKKTKKKSLYWGTSAPDDEKSEMEDMKRQKAKRRRNKRRETRERTQTQEYFRSSKRHSKNARVPELESWELYP